MGKKWFSRLLLLVTAVCILLPAALLLVWSVTGRWPWPRLTPETYTLRTLRELLLGSTSLLQLLGSSVALAGATAVLSTAVALLTARATELYRFPGRSLARFCGLLPLLIPGTVFAIGVHLVFGTAQREHTDSAFQILRPIGGAHHAVAQLLLHFKSQAGFGQGIVLILFKDKSVINLRHRVAGEFNVHHSADDLNDLSDTHWFFLGIQICFLRHGGGTTDDFGDFLRNAGLTGLVVDELQFTDQLLGVVRSGLHGHHTGRLL